MNFRHSRILCKLRQSKDTGHIFLQSLVITSYSIHYTKLYENKLELKGVTPEQFRAKVQVKELKFENRTDANGEFSMMGVDGMVKPNNVGQASLPVISKLMEVPYGADISYNFV